MIDNPRPVARVLVVQISAVVIAAVKIGLAINVLIENLTERLETMSQIERCGGSAVLRHENGSLDPTYQDASLVMRFTAKVEKVYFASTRLQDKVLNRLKCFPEISFVSFNSTSFSDDQLTFLEPLENLRELQLNGTRITDDGVRRLADRHKLRILTLNDTSITDEAIESLASMKSLKKLYLRKTKLSASGLESLHATLPNCQVYH